MSKTEHTRREGIAVDRTFSTAEVSDMAQVSFRQLQWWDERKVISPRHDGHKRVYRLEEVVTIRVIAELRRKGLTLQKLRRVVRILHRELGKRLSDVLKDEAELYLLTDGKSVHVQDDPGRVIDLLKDSRQPMFLVCVSDQARGVGMLVKK